MPKRAEVPPKLFNSVKKKTSPAIKPQPPAIEEATKKPGGKAAMIKVSVYLSQEQIDKLFDITVAYRRQHRKEITRNDVVRHLVDQTTIDALLKDEIEHNTAHGIK